MFKIFINYISYKMSFILIKIIYYNSIKFDIYYNYLQIKHKDNINLFIFNRFLINKIYILDYKYWENYDVSIELKFKKIWIQTQAFNNFYLKYKKKIKVKYTLNNSFLHYTFFYINTDSKKYNIRKLLLVFFIWYNLLILYTDIMYKFYKNELGLLRIYNYSSILNSNKIKNKAKLLKWNKLMNHAWNYKISNKLNLFKWKTIMNHKWNFFFLNSYVLNWFELNITKYEFKKKYNKYKNNIDYFLIKNFQIFYLFYKFFKNFLFPSLIAFLFIYYTFFFFKLSFLKTMSNWAILSFFIFWLLSTFNFFIKRYKYAKYTSAIQRFWKRAFMCFWAIEGFLFIIFFYYLLNASGEPLFMFDTYGLYNYYLLTIKFFLINSFLIVLLLNLFLYLLINTKFNSLKKNMYLLFIITIILLYILLTESYQFYYLLNFYVEYVWNISEDDNVWELDYDIPRTRNKNHYVTLIILAKFWHYIFIFVSWVFFVIKTLELNRIRYTFLSMNFQNIILFYIMNWLCLYSWLKWLIKRFTDQIYYWFFISFRPTSINIIIFDILNYVQSINLYFIDITKNFINFNFFYSIVQVQFSPVTSYYFKTKVFSNLIY